MPDIPSREHVRHLIGQVRGNGACPDAPLLAAYDALRARVDEREQERDAAKKETVKWQRIRQPTHGNCCTCQRCGVHHDDCRCDLDELCDEMEQLKQQLAAAQAEIARLKGE